MNTNTTVKLDDLLHALDWVSGDLGMDNAAFVSRDTGKLFLVSDELDWDDEEERPADLEDETLYAPVPTKRDLDLGSRLVFRFVEEHLPDDYETVSAYFRKRGAWSRFKDLLDHRDALDAWHEFESEAVAAALRDWCAEEGLRLDA